MKQYAHMKKNPNKLFEILSEDTNNVKLMDLSSGEEKTIKVTTFRKSYRYGKGDAQVPDPTAIVKAEEKPKDLKQIGDDMLDAQRYAMEQALGGVTETQDTTGGPKTPAESEKAKETPSEDAGNTHWLHPESDNPVVLGPKDPTHKEVENGELIEITEEQSHELDKAFTEQAEANVCAEQDDLQAKLIPEEPGTEPPYVTATEATDTVPHNQPGWDLTPKAPNRATQIEERERAWAEAKPFIPNPFVLRQSMVNTYLQCPAKFYAIYEEGKEDPGSKFTEMGTAVHAVLEAYYNNEFVAEDVDEAFDYYWQKYGPNEFSDYQDCLAMTKDFLRRNPEKPNVIATELNFLVNVDGIPLSGTIDRIDRIDERTIRIVDYKTNQRPWSKGELEESIQFHMYDLAALQLKDRLGDFDRIINTYEMLRLGYSQTVEYTMDELKDFTQWLKIIWTKMLSGVDREARPHQYCINNPIADACKELNAKLLDGVDDIADTLEGLTEQLETLKIQEKLVKTRKAEVESLIKEAISQNGGEITVGDKVWSTNSQARTTYPASKAIPALTLNGYSHILPEIVTINNTNLKKLMSKDDTLALVMERVAETNYTSPSLSSRKVKKGD